MSKSPSLRRIQADIRELSIDPSDQYHAAPLESDMFVWHFTIRGASDTDFEGGIYHGKILLSSEYPFKPPDIMFLTPNGRFETNTKLCLSFSAYHPELWQPAWGIRLILEALISFLPTKGDGAIGALEWTSNERKRLAKKSWEYNSPVYGNCKEFMDKWSARVKQSCGDKKKKSKFQKEIEQLHALQAATEGKKEDEDEVEDESDNATNTSAKEDDATTNEEKESTEHKGSEEMETQREADPIANEEKETTSSTSENAKLFTDDESVNEPALIMDAVKSDAKIVDNKQLVDGTGAEVESIDNHVQGNESEAKAKTENEPSPNNATMTENQMQATDDQPVIESPLYSDPVVHSGIVIFSVIVYLLFRKLQDVVSDLKELEAEFYKS